MIQINRSELASVLRLAERDLVRAIKFGAPIDVASDPALPAVRELLAKLYGPREPEGTLAIEFVWDRRTGTYQAIATHPGDERVVARSNRFATRKEAALDLQRVLERHVPNLRVRNVRQGRGRRN